MVVKHIHDPIFGVNYVLAYNFKSNSLAPLNRKLKSWFDAEFNINDMVGDESGFCVDCTLDKGLFVIIVLRKLTNSPEDKSILAHECFHATEAVFKNRGIKHCKETTEVWAYNIGMLIRTFYESLSKKTRINKREIKKIIKYHTEHG